MRKPVRIEIEPLEISGQWVARIEVVGGGQAVIVQSTWSELLDRIVEFLR